MHLKIMVSFLTGLLVSYLFFLEQDHKKDKLYNSLKDAPIVLASTVKDRGIDISNNRPLDSLNCIGEKEKDRRRLFSSNLEGDIPALTENVRITADDTVTMMDSISDTDEDSLEYFKSSLHSAVQEGNEVVIGALKDHLYISTDNASKILALEAFTATDMGDIPEELRVELLDAIRVNVVGQDVFSHKALETLSFLSEGDAQTQSLILTSYLHAENVEHRNSIVALLGSVRHPLTETTDLMQEIAENNYEDLGLRSAASSLLELWQM